MSRSRAMRPIGLSSFAEYVDAPGSEQMRRIAEQYKWYNEPDGFAPVPYRAASEGMRAAVVEQDPEVLTKMIGRATDVMRPHYEQLANGFGAFMQRYRPTFIETTASSWRYGDLTLTLNQHIGMQIGRDRCIVFPYLKQPELTHDGAKIVWRTLELARALILPESKIVVLDVRRVNFFRPTRKNRNHLDYWIESRALGYVEHWRRMMDAPPPLAS